MPIRGRTDALYLYIRDTWCQTGGELAAKEQSGALKHSQLFLGEGGLLSAIFG